jgi:hypothetical protein
LFISLHFATLHSLIAFFNISIFAFSIGPSICWRTTTTATKHICIIPTFPRPKFPTQSAMPFAQFQLSQLINFLQNCSKCLYTFTYILKFFILYTYVDDILSLLHIRFIPFMRFSH